MKNFTLSLLLALFGLSNYVNSQTLSVNIQPLATMDAAVKNFEVIGEATKNIPDDFRAAHPDLPWKNMAGMRDKLIHDYESIDYW